MAGDEFGRADLQLQARVTSQRLDALESAHPGWLQSTAIRELLELLVHTPPWTGAPRWVHGDLYPRHLVLDEHHDLTGVIDWGDVHLGDPALDLSAAFTVLPAGPRKAFLDAAGGVDSATLARARFRGLVVGVAMVSFGLLRGDDVLATLGARALRQTLA